MKIIGIRAADVSAGLEDSCAAGGRCGGDWGSLKVGTVLVTRGAINAAVQKSPENDI